MEKRIIRVDDQYYAGLTKKKAEKGDPWSNSSWYNTSKKMWFPVFVDNINKARKFDCFTNIKSEINHIFSFLYKRLLREDYFPNEIVIERVQE